MNLTKRTGSPRQVKFHISPKEAETLDRVRDWLKKDSDTCLVAFVIWLHELGYIQLKPAYAKKARESTPLTVPRSVSLHEEDLKLLELVYPKQTQSVKIRACLYAVMDQFEVKLD